MQENYFITIWGGNLHKLDVRGRVVYSKIRLMVVCGCFPGSKS